MSDIILIHGYGVGMKLALKEDTKIHLGFKSFEELIKTDQASLFEWFSDRRVNVLQFFNPIVHYQVYKAERELTTSTEIHLRLERFINTHRPKTIVCHSMGCLLFLQYILKHDLPDFVKNIVFVQADLPRKMAITNIALMSKLKSNEIIWLNYYCFLDYTLITSMFLNFYLPAGLFGGLNRYIKNIFFLLNSSVNIHISAISNKKFAQEIIKL